LDIFIHFQVPFLKEKLAEKEEQLHEMVQKYSSNKQVLTENWHQAAAEVRRQYEAIDGALEVRLIIHLLERSRLSWRRTKLQYYVKGIQIFKVFVQVLCMIYVNCVAQWFQKVSLPHHQKITECLG
jgi:hypothetical protein